MQSNGHFANYIISIKVLLNHITSHVGLQRLRNADTLWSLEVFKQSSYDTRQSQSRTIQCVAQLNLLVCIAIATLQTIGLLTIKI